MCCVDKPPFEKLKSLLTPTGRDIDVETAITIQRYYGDWLRNVVTIEGAIELLETASRHYHLSTQARIASQNNILLDGIFSQSDSNSAELYRAFRINSSQPKVVKFGANISREYECFIKLGLSCEDSLRHFIVPIEEFIVDDNGKTGLVMPMFACSLSCYNADRRTESQLLEAAVFQGVNQIAHALSILHAKHIKHNDIKPSNIFLDFNGVWYLGDWGSVYFEGLSSKTIQYTHSFIPRDLVKSGINRNSNNFDKLLLVVTAIVLLGLLDFTRGFTVRDIEDSIERVHLADLKHLLKDLLVYGK